MMKRLLLFIVAATLMYTAAAAETMTCIIPEGQYVNVRNQSSTKAATLGKARNGDTVEAEEVQRGWICYETQGQAAYVRAEYFEAVDGGQYAIAGNGRVRYRDAPNGKTAGFYQVGDVVTVDAWRYDEKGGRWARIGKQYVMAEFLQPLETEEAPQ